jgi:uncharacterized protein YjlB
MNQETIFSHLDVRFEDVLNSPQVVYHIIKDDGIYPNNETLPLLVYQNALTLPKNHNPAAIFETLFEANQWGGSWRNGVYGFHHYHSTAHEVLGVFGGTARIQLGGEKGMTLSVSRGDVVVIPAGVAHKNLGASQDFRVVGAYPFGQSPDMCYGKSNERPQADQNIARVAFPKSDPVYGSRGPLIEHWGN